MKLQPRCLSQSRTNCPRRWSIELSLSFTHYMHYICTYIYVCKICTYICADRFAWLLCPNQCAKLRNPWGQIAPWGDLCYPVSQSRLYLHLKKKRFIICSRSFISILEASYFVSIYLHFTFILTHLNRFYIFF